MRTVKAPEIRRQEILDGAMAVFLEKGYEKTTIADISRALGISQGLCYRYFASKEEIYNAVIDAYATSIAEANLRIRPESQPIGRWIDAIPGMLGDMQVAEKENAPLYALLHQSRNERMHRELCMKVGEKLIPAVTRALEQACESSEIHLTDCRETAVFGVYGEIGLLIAGGTDSVEAIRNHWRTLLGIQ